MGDGTGIGDCKKYDQHKVKHPGAGTPQGKCLYPNRERNCSKFLLKANSYELARTCNLKSRTSTACQFHFN